MEFNNPEHHYDYTYEENYDSSISCEFYLIALSIKQKRDPITTIEWGAHFLLCLTY